MKVGDNYQNIELINNSSGSIAGRNVEEDKDRVHELEKDRNSGTRVDFSETSVEFSRAAEEMERESTERARKVSEIETRVRKGDYAVDATKVAEKILKDALADLG